MLTIHAENADLLADLNPMADGFPRDAFSARAMLERYPIDEGETVQRSFVMNTGLGEADDQQDQAAETKEALIL